MHGIGNDFVLIDGITSPVPYELSDLARQMCCPRMGVGADGLILAKKRGDRIQMEMFNPDGSEGGMCGNGIRCLARLVIDRGYAPNQFQLDTGERSVEVGVRGDQVSVQMGGYRSDAASLGLAEVDDLLGNEHFVAGRPWTTWAVSMGNPHWVFFGTEIDDVDLASVGPPLENHVWFVNRTNVHFAEVVSHGRIRIRTWERGAGVTLACGSGACAVAVAGQLSGQTLSQVNVELPGGDLQIAIAENRFVTMTGPATYCFSGDWPSR